METLPSSWIQALQGGALIGLAVTLMLVFNGRVTGISGILYRCLINPERGNWWRLSFLIGLLCGGLFLQQVAPETLVNSLSFSKGRLVVAGLLVGYGTLLGNGCTSGHGVCGISRFSLRSMVATITFMASGIITVLLFGEQ